MWETTSEIMSCKVYLEKSNGRVEVQLRAARVLAGCHSLGGESVKFCFWGVLSPSANGIQEFGVNLRCCPTSG